MKDTKEQWFEWLCFEANQLKVTVKLHPRVKEKYKDLEPAIPGLKAYDAHGRKSSPRQPRNVMLGTLRATPSPNPATVFKKSGAATAMARSHRPKRHSPSYMNRPLSPASKTPVNPKSSEWWQKSPGGTRASVRNDAESCCFRAPSILGDRTVSPLPGVRPQTTMAVIRPMTTPEEIAAAKLAMEAPEEEEAGEEDWTFNEEDFNKTKEPEKEAWSSTKISMPQRQVLHKMGMADCLDVSAGPVPQGYRTNPGVPSYEMIDHIQLGSPPLSPSKYEQPQHYYKVKDQSPKKTRPFCTFAAKGLANMTIRKHPPLPEYEGPYPPTPEQVCRRERNESRKRNLTHTDMRHGEWNLSFPKNGEFFGGASVKHWLPATNSRVGLWVAIRMSADILRGPSNRSAHRSGWVGEWAVGAERTSSGAPRPFLQQKKALLWVLVGTTSGLITC